MARPTPALCALLLPLLLCEQAVAQPNYEGQYAVAGTDASRGAYTGRLELRAQGAAYEIIREVTFQQTPAPSGRSLTLVWLGTAVPRGNDLDLSFTLSRIDWITEAGGLTRSLADQVPDVVTGRYRPDPAGGLSGALRSQGGVAATDAILRSGPAGATPLFQNLRSRDPMHSAPPSWLKPILFNIFVDYHRRPEVFPFTTRPDFQNAVHLRVFDPTGFDWLRANPGKLLLQNKRVDAISLAEAEVRAGAYGLRLFEKAGRYDVDVETRHRDTTGLLAFGRRDTPAGPVFAEDMSTFLWSATYAFSQRCRWLTTQDPQALTNVAQMAEVFCDMIEIDPRPGEFARSLRPIGRSPLGGSWKAGQGRFAHLAYHDNGNNDMIKGFWLAFISAWEVLPANHPLRPRIARCVREIADSWATSNPSAAGGTGHDRDGPKNLLLNNMLAFWITGDAAYETAYKAQLRKPKLLAELATGGTFALYGIGDWSGTHLGICGKIALIELGRKLNSRWQPLFEHALSMNWRFMKPYRMTPFAVAAAGYLGKQDARDPALWQLREFPYPKPKHGIDRTLDLTYSYSPFPSLPWKLDWAQGGRNKSLYEYPVFMRPADNYVFRSSPFNRGGGPSVMEHHGGDYLFVYWLARHLRVVPANE